MRQTCLRNDGECMAENNGGVSAHGSQMPNSPRMKSGLGVEKTVARRRTPRGMGSSCGGQGRGVGTRKSG